MEHSTHASPIHDSNDITKRDGEGKGKKRFKLLYCTDTGGPFKRGEDERGKGESELPFRLGLLHEQDFCTSFFRGS